VNVFFETAVRLFYLERCIGCHAPSSAVFCIQCDVQALSPRVSCPGCGITPLSSELCAQCGISEAVFDGVSCAFEYGGAVANAVAALKFRRATEVARRFASICIPPSGSWDLLIPVPLHARRLRARGYNHSALIAHHVGRSRSIRVDVRSLQRTRPTLAQRKLSVFARWKNVRGAFQVESSSSISGKRILLIDDVMTTGATLTECATVLRKNGAAAVGAWTVARRS
jgi:ComF family protein